MDRWDWLARLGWGDPAGRFFQHRCPRKQGCLPTKDLVGPRGALDQPLSIWHR